MRLLGSVLLVALLALVPASTTLGADMMIAAKSALKTALTHAGFAAGYDAVAEIEQKLHQVVNCLEGDKGKNYHQPSGNPCMGQGTGIIADLKQSGMAGAHAIPFAEIADQIALWGISQTMNKDVARAKSAASVVQVTLQLTIDNFK